MTPLPFSSLTKQQRQQAAYLFADALFGTDANAYLYELDKTGDVKGRVTSDKGQATNDRARAAIRPPVKVIMQKEAAVTEEMIQHARMNMDALAACVARKIYLSQLEEVRP